MPDGQVLEFAGVTKRFGAVTAVSGFSARVEPGLVTGFLGPNGAGKTTTLRILLGLVRATGGAALIGGEPYAELRTPLQSVGAVLEASSFHPGRTAANHLTIYAHAAGLPVARVDEVLGMVGLAEVAGSKVGGFSLGMKQRLSLAYALLGDPGVLILDEPSNGLDPEGIIWMRSLLRELARQGRTVLVSSHMLAEVQQTVDALLIISQGRLVFQGGLDELTDPGDFVTVVDSPDRAGLAAALRDAGAEFELLRSGLTVRSSTPADVGTIAATAGVGLSLLQERGPGLEEVFLDLVNGTRVHPSAASDGSDAPDAASDGSDAPDAASDGSDAPDAGSADAPDAAADDAPDADASAAASAGSRDAAGGNLDADVDDDDDEDDAASIAAAPPRSAFAVATTGVIDVLSADEQDAEADGPDYFEPTDAVTDPAPGAAEDDADPSTGDVIIPASEADEASDEPGDLNDADTDLENEKRPAAPRWEAQFDPVVDPDADGEISDSDRDADEFFATAGPRRPDTGEPAPESGAPTGEPGDEEEER